MLQMMKRRPLPGEGPLHVVVLAGQSNAGGKVPIPELADHLAKPEAAEHAQYLRGPDGVWFGRLDVWGYYRTKEMERYGPLGIGLGERPDEVGPELSFAKVVGDAVNEQVLLVKYTRGSMSLGEKCLPPSSEGETGEDYNGLVEEVKSVLLDVSRAHPRFAGPDNVRVSLVWFQGWNDMYEGREERYEANLANLIRDLRKDLGVADMRVVIGEFGPHGPVIESPDKRIEKAARKIRDAQRAVAAMPEFKDTVRFVPTAELVTPGLTKAMHHYHRDPATFLRIGQALGKAWVEVHGK